MLKVLALLTLLMSAAVHAQPMLHTDLPLKYLEQANSDSVDQPLVIFLHGYGSFMVRLKGSQDLVANCGVFRSHRGFGQGLEIGASVASKNAARAKSRTC